MTKKTEQELINIGEANGYTGTQLSTFKVGYRACESELLPKIEKFEKQKMQLLQNETDEDTRIRGLFRNIYSAEDVDGDSFAVPPLSALVEKAVRDILHLQEKLE